MDGTKIMAKSRGEQLVDFISAAPGRSYPEEVMRAARMAFADYIALAVACMDDAAPTAVAASARSWGASGKSTVFRKFRTAPALAAMVNGTSTHSQDYDDTHALGAGHPSGPVWSTVLALTEDLGRTEEEAFTAYITGYEVMAKLASGGPKGVGRSLQRKGFHPTSIVGRIGSAAAAAVLYRLDRTQTASALGAAATMAGGLIGSFGTESKPFHSGVAAMNGILAAQLAQNGFKAATTLFELDKGLLAAMIQDGSAEVPTLDDFGSNWEILQNGFKLYASCRGTHAAIETATRLRERVAGRPIRDVTVYTIPHSLITAGKTEVNSGFEGKFSNAFCVAMALNGYPMMPENFVDDLLDDGDTVSLFKRTTHKGRDDLPPGSAEIDVTLEDGEVLTEMTPATLGLPTNPLGWDALERKCLFLLEPVIGADKAAELFAAAQIIDQPGSIAKVLEIAAPLEGS